jgi:hypothetical protein
MNTVVRRLLYYFVANQVWRKMKYWEFNRKLCFTLSLAALLLSAVLPVKGWAAEEPVPSCDRGIAQFLKDRLTFKQTRVRVKKVIAFQKQYWKEVKESEGDRLIETAKNSLPARYSADLVALCKDAAPSLQGCIKGVIKRVLVLDREHPDDIRWKGYLYSPGDWPSLPFALPFELLQDRYRLTAPSRFLLSLPVVTAAAITVDTELDRKFDELLKSDVTPGLEYLRELGHLGLLEPGFIGRQLGLNTSRLMSYYTHEHVEKMEDWRQSHGHPSYLEKLGLLKKLGLLRTRAELGKISQRAFEIYRKEERKSDASLASRFEKEWQRRLGKDPFFRQYSPEVRHLLGMIFNVPFEVEGHSDFELLARSYGLKLKNIETPDPLNALHPLSHELSDASLVRLAWETLKHPEEAPRKQDRWAEKFPDEDHPFLHRVDLFSIRAWGELDFDQEGSSEHLAVMKDELSYWELAWKDERFADIKDAYLKKNIGEVDALKSIHQRIKAYNDLYAASRATAEPDEKKLCAWAGQSGKESSNILIQGPVSDYLRQLEGQRKLSSSEREGCQIDLAEYMYNSYIRELQSRKGAQALDAPESSGDGLEIVLSLCPLPLSPRSCQ